MSEASVTIAFFDIGNTLAAVRVSASGDRIEQINVYPDVLPVLQALRQENVRLGILSNRGSIPEQQVNNALTSGRPLRFFDPNLILIRPKDSPRLFEQAAARAPGWRVEARSPPAAPALCRRGCLERGQARATDFLVVPSSTGLALPVLRQLVHYVPPDADPDEHGSHRTGELASEPTAGTATPDSGGRTGEASLAAL